MAIKEEPITTTAIKEMLKAVINDDIKITISRDEFIPRSARICIEGKNNKYTQMLNHLDLGLTPVMVEHISMLITNTLQELIKKERQMK